jgi:hypothetical protein
LPALLTHLAQTQRALSDLAIRHASLDDVFVKLAGRHLEDATTVGGEFIECISHASTSRPTCTKRSPERRPVQW